MSVSTLVTTAGASNANGYVTLAVANQYHEDRPPVSTTWAVASDAEKTAAIIWATKMLDSLIDWEGSVVDDTQVLDWPRYGMIYPSGYGVDSASIPTGLQEAAAEFARQLLVSDRAGDSDVEAQGITSIKAGPVSLQFKDSIYSKIMPDAVFHMLPREWYVEIRGRISGIRELLRT